MAGESKSRIRRSRRSEFVVDIDRGYNLILILLLWHKEPGWQGVTR
jgi:hypothetical protein